MASENLVALSRGFAVEMIRLCEAMKKRGKATVIINQLLRSGTSIGANIHEANYASSKADFVNKFQIALKECYETDYWIQVFYESDMLSLEEYRRVYNQCSKIRKMLVASINTAKEGQT